MHDDMGEADYRRAGFERLEEALILYRSEMFAGSVYLAGRAVESMLRAVIWKFDSEIKSGRKSLDTGHDLRKLLNRVDALGVVIQQKHRDELVANIQRISRVWSNNMRFVPTRKMQRFWWKVGETGTRHSLKQAVSKFHATCSAIVKRCEVLCE